MAERRALHIQNESTDPAGLFVEALEQAGFAVETLHPYDGDALPETLDGVDAVVAGGGLVDTHQAGEFPWIAREIQLVREALVHGTPFMGLCLGAQVLTEASGGSVYRCTPHEIGWHPVELTAAADGDALFDGLPARFQAMQWHYYACRPGDGSVELMTQPRVAAGASGRRQRLGHAVPHRGDAAGAAALAGHGRRRPGRQRLPARPLPAVAGRAPGRAPAGRPHAGRAVRGAGRGPRYTASSVSSAAYSGRCSRRALQAATAG